MFFASSMCAGELLLDVAQVDIKGYTLSHIQRCRVE